MCGSAIVTTNITIGSEVCNVVGQKNVGDGKDWDRIFVPLVQQPNAGQDRHVLEVSRSHTVLHNILLTRDRPVAETST